MGTYFLDTSAIVKRYVTEPGSDWVMEHCQPKVQHAIIISQAALVETVATFCRKARAQNLSERISEADREKNILLFRQDVKRQYTVVRVTSVIYAHAGDLCRFHKLRAYDAVQLACVLKVHMAFATLGIPAPIFVSADADLLNIAYAEGLRIDNPNKYLKGEQS